MTITSHYDTIISEPNKRFTNKQKGDQITMCKETLCWTCKHCTGATLPTTNHQSAASGVTITPNGGTLFQCPWATHGQPVEGWTAEPTKLKIKPDEVIDSYEVKSCPFYAADLEAQIDAMAPEEIAKMLCIPLSFVKKAHSKICKQVLYTYIQRYNKAKRLSKTGTLTRKEAYLLRTQIVRELLIYAQEDIDLIEDSINSSAEEQNRTDSNTNSNIDLGANSETNLGTRTDINLYDLYELSKSESSSSDDERYLTQARQTVEDCKELLHRMEFTYKKQSRQLATAKANQTL